MLKRFIEVAAKPVLWMELNHRGLLQGNFCIRAMKKRRNAVYKLLYIEALTSEGVPPPK